MKIKAKALEEQQKQDPINEKEEINISYASSNKNTLREQQVIFAYGNWLNFKEKKKNRKRFASWLVKLIVIKLHVNRYLPMALHPIHVVDIFDEGVSQFIIKSRFLKVKLVIWL